METMKWLELACSKDKTRFNLNEVYRDKTCLVGCDGCRLHLSSGLSEVEAHYLSGLDAEYPDYKQAFPKHTIADEEEKQLQAIRFNGIIGKYGLADDLKKLKKLASFIRLYDRDCCVVLSHDEKQGVHLSYSNPEGFECKYRLPSLEANKYLKEAGEVKIGVNLQYFHDALLIAHEDSGSIILNGELGPILFEAGKRKAVIMPIRLT